jgi:H+/gluconate symporter-like permease
MQIYVILIACVVLLLCLFFKVPVFISVFAGALVYFLLGASSSPAILAQRIISGCRLTVWEHSERLEHR